MNAIGATIVDWSQLGRVVLYSLVATVGTGVAFGLAVRGAARLVEVRRAGRLAEAMAYGALAATAALVSLAAVGYGIFLLTQK